MIKMILGISKGVKKGGQKMDKKSIIALICCAVLVFSGLTSISYGDTEDDQSIRYIKVGLNYPITSDKQINLYNNKGFSVKTFKEDFQELFSFVDTMTTVRLDYHFQNIDKQTGPFHIEYKETFDSYEKAVAKLNQLKFDNIDIFPVYENGVFKIWIGQYSNEVDASEDISRIYNKLQIQLNVVKDNKQRVVLENSKGNIVIIFDAKEQIYIGPYGKELEESIIGVGDRSYRGFITFNRIEDELKVINYINLEKYLYGVVPREMSGDWPIEALKAQAVAARNYALISLGKHLDEGYDICDTTHCQVYAGYSWEKIRSNQAVDETLDKVIKYDGKLISTYYHSSSGGKTEDSENVWSNPVPYLKGVDDKFSLGAPNDNWKLVLSREEIMEKLNSIDVNVGEILAIDVLEYSNNDRVLKLAIKGTEGVHILEKDGARGVLGYNSLKSTMFSTKSNGEAYVLGASGSKPTKMSLGEASIITAEGTQIANRDLISRDNPMLYVTNGKNKETIPAIPTQYIFEGHGWGHGLGMSQWGAKKMAEEGYNYEEILEYYYTDAKVE
ncbi:MAG: SpoIID/LytB domain-containing protein [Firmicutes bacterium]|nr:SpoIID/LytB domain-containing protein [Bacillota bacterium]